MLEVVPAGVNKWGGVELLLRHLGLPARCVGGGGGGGSGGVTLMFSLLNVTSNKANRQAPQSVLKTRNPQVHFDLVAVRRLSVASHRQIKGGWAGSK